MEQTISISQKSSSDKFKKLFGLGLLLSLATLVIHLFRIEYVGNFDYYFPFVATAIFLHNLFPFQFRKYLFSFWTLTIFSIIAGPIFSVGTFAIILIAASITFLPKKILRNFAAICLFAGMIAGRMYLHNPVVSTWITCAGLFIMLRFIFLLYEISFIKVKPSFLLRVNYLFMLPNIFFPLFPIVDPLVFFKSKEEDSDEAIAQGKTWLIRGILHLLFYRLIYLYISPSIYELHTWYDLLIFILSGYSLILRLSGIFYLSGGILSLMGYKLPPVFENYFLVRNFRDLWRRINLYWRHFMWRVFYYPMLFRLKKWNQKTAVLTTVLVMFIVTWLLHGWQWYWVKGNFPLVANDIVYWSIFGIILACVSVKAFSKKSSKTVSPFMNGVGIISMFFAMSILWSLWTSSSLQEWLYIVSKFSKLNSLEIIYLALSVIGIFLVGGIISVLQSKTNLFSIFVREQGNNFRLVILFLLIGVGIFYKIQNNNFNLPLVKMVDPQLNMTDRVIVERGYYEQLLTKPKISMERIPLFKKVEVNDFQNEAYQDTTGLLPRILKPNFKTTFKGKVFTTNSFGMRDKEYNLKKDSLTWRICLLGGSYEMGSGVADGETFEQLLEDYSNRMQVKTEILNMGVGGYHAFQMLKIAETKCLQFHPDEIIYVVHSGEKQRMITNILGLINSGRDLEYPYLKQIVKESGIDSGKMCQLEMYDRLYPYADSLLNFIYSSFNQTCIQNKIKPVCIYLPAIGDLREDPDKAEAFLAIKKQGIQLIDLSGIFNGMDIHTITVSDEDTHPNKLGHQIIAHALENK